MFDFLNKSTSDILDNLCEPMHKPNNPLKTTFKNKQVASFDTIILTPEQRTLYYEFKSKSLPQYVESVKTYNKNVEFLVAVSTAKLLYSIGRPFYFKHRFDFRGRVYKSGTFSYDRGDLYRSLLEFHEGSFVTEDNVK